MMPSACCCVFGPPFWLRYYHPLAHRKPRWVKKCRRCGLIVPA